MKSVELFARLLLPVLGLCIVGATVFASFSSVNGLKYPDATTDYYPILKAKATALQNGVTQSAGQDPQELRDAALVLWQNGELDPAERYLHKLWTDKAATKNNVYDADFVRDAQNLADLLVDRGSFEQAGETYACIFNYDSAHLAKYDARIARDMNNIGLCYFLAGQCVDDFPSRKICFDKALKQYRQAEAIFQRHPECQSQLVYNLQNQAMAYSELGDDARALALNRQVETALTNWHRG